MITRLKTLMTKVDSKYTLVQRWQRSKAANLRASLPLVDEEDAVDRPFPSLSGNCS